MHARIRPHDGDLMPAQALRLWLYSGNTWAEKEPGPQFVAPSRNRSRKVAMQQQIGFSQLVPLNMTGN